VHLRAPGTVVAAGSSAGYDDGRRSVTSAEVLAEVMSALGR
jgi:copper homeostasis protein